MRQKKRILIAFDESENSMRAVVFAAEIFSREDHITLFHVVPKETAGCNIHEPSLTPSFFKERKSFCEVEEKRRLAVEGAIHMAREKLLSAGFEAARTITKIEPAKQGVARDLIAEAFAGYDIVIMGRRGLSATREFFMGSISQKVIHAVKNKAIILIE
jgi:nucleotide-binding universal stress UspA family protein